MSDFEPFNEPDNSAKIITQAKKVAKGIRSEELTKRILPFITPCVHITHEICLKSLVMTLLIGEQAKIPIEIPYEKEEDIEADNSTVMKIIVLLEDTFNK